MAAQVPQVDYRANPSFAGDVAQGVDSYEQPNAAPAVPVCLPDMPDPDTIDDSRAMIPGYVQEGLGLDLAPSIREQAATFTPDVAGQGYRSW